MEAPDRVTETFGGLVRGLCGRDVVGPDEDHRGIRRRAGDEHRVHLACQAAGCSTDDRLGAQPHTLPGLRGEAPRHQDAGDFVGHLATETCGGRVAEHHQGQVGVAETGGRIRRGRGGVDAVGAGRAPAWAPDDVAGRARLILQEVVAEPGGRPDSGAGPDRGRPDLRAGDEGIVSATRGSERK